MILYVLSGLPGAGKTTQALKLVKETNAILLCRDELRESYRNQVDEPDLTQLLAVQARYLLDRGYQVIVDSWNLTTEDEDLWFMLAADCRVVVQWIHIKTPVDVCVERDAGRPQSIGEHYVREAAKEYAVRLDVLADD